MRYTSSMHGRSARRLTALALRIQSKPWNRRGADKTFVFTVLRQYHATLRAIRH